MKNFVLRLQQQISPLFLSLCLSATCVLAAGTSALAASSPVQAARIRAEVTSSSMTRLPGSLHPLAQARNESGRLNGATRMEGITLFFSRTEAQQKALDALIRAQGDKSSPLFHKWLTPEQFGARFGVADADIAKVRTWLESQGFSIDSVARGKDSIRFSGAASQVEAAFATELHRYTLTIDGKAEPHFAPSTALSIPSAMAGVVLGVRNLDNFKARSMRKAPTGDALNNLRGDMGSNGGLKSQFTSGSSGTNFLAPGDVSTIYDVKALAQAGYSGIGQTIAIMGQSAVVLSDVTAFQTAAGLTVKAPTTILVPGTGTSTLYQGDEGESDLDLEWSGAMAPGAQILFVYTGNAANTSGVFDSAQYTVDNNLAQIISISYGACEYDLGTSNAAILEAIASRAPAQGQTILAASGDSGSTACSNKNSTDATNLKEQLNVSYPASSPYVTGVGGTTFNEGGNTSTYWSSNGSSDVITSALLYIPEVVWNDDSTNGLASTGGGISSIFTKPNWQTGVTGIPSGNTRFVPDISLDASNNHDAYLYCTSDTSAWTSGQGASCDKGFRDSNTNFLTAAGGTSFATPVFAGMLALINDYQNYANGQGLINPTLYQLAAVPATYAAAFNDITIGDNKCRGGSAYCSGVIGYAAGTGYDLATGLGTVKLDSLALAWPAGSPSIIGTTTTVTATSTAPNVNTNVTFAAAVGSAFGVTVPTGTVTFTLDGTTGTLGGTTTGGTVLATKTLSGGSASFTGAIASAGAHVVLVSYSGDSTHGASTGVVSLTVGGTSTGTGTFALAAGNITVARGSVGTSTVTVTPAGGYKGTVQFSLSTSSSALNSACYTIANATVTGTTAATTTLSLDTSAANCAATGAVVKGKSQKIRVAGFGTGGGGPFTVVAAMLGLLLAGIVGWSSRKVRGLRVLAGVILLAAVGFALTGCGGGGGSSTTSDPAKGTYTLTLTGADSTTATITSTTNVTLTIN